MHRMVRGKHAMTKNTPFLHWPTTASARQGCRATSTHNVRSAKAKHRIINLKFAKTPRKYETHGVTKKGS